MELMTEALRLKLPPLYEHEGLPYANAYAKFFAPWTPHAWWVAEHNGEDTLYGFIEGYPNRWDNFSLSDLEAERGPEGDRLRMIEFLSPVILSHPWSARRWLGRRLQSMQAALNEFSNRSNAW